MTNSGSCALVSFGIMIGLTQESYPQAGQKKIHVLSTHQYLLSQTQDAAFQFHHAIIALSILGQDTFEQPFLGLSLEEVSTHAKNDACVAISTRGRRRAFRTCTLSKSML